MKTLLSVAFVTLLFAGCTVPSTESKEQIEVVTSDSTKTVDSVITVKPIKDSIK